MSRIRANHRRKSENAKQQLRARLKKIAAGQAVLLIGALPFLIDWLDDFVT